MTRRLFLSTKSSVNNERGRVTSVPILLNMIFLVRLWFTMCICKPFLLFFIKLTIIENGNDDYCIKCVINCIYVANSLPGCVPACYCTASIDIGVRKDIMYRYMYFPTCHYEYCTTIGIFWLRSPPCWRYFFAPRGTF
jgi:hypothetical protein